MKNSPLDKAAEALKAEQGSERRQQAGQVMWKATPLPSATPASTTPPKEGSKLTMQKAKSMVTAAADAVGLDGKFGFQNSFNSIKGMGKIKDKKK